MTKKKQINSDGQSGLSGQIMRASFLHGVRDVRLQECPIPTPGPDEVLLRIASAGICGSDIHFYVDGRIGEHELSTPTIMGHEFSGVIAALGPGVEKLEIGQLVAVEPGIPCNECEFCEHGHPNLCPNIKFCGSPPINGVYAEYITIPAANCFPMPSDFSPDDGAMLEPLGIAIHAVDLAHMRPGYTVAVLGAGPIGLLIAAVAKAAGASAVYMTEPLPYRIEFARSYIADHVLNPEKDDIVAEIEKITNGRGVDIVFEAAGASDTVQNAADLVRIGGKVIVVGIPSSDSYHLRATTVRRKGLTIKLVRRMKHTYPRAINLVQTGQVDVKPLVTHRLPLEKTKDGLDMVAEYANGVIKVVIHPT